MAVLLSRLTYPGWSVPARFLSKEINMLSWQKPGFGPFQLLSQGTLVPQKSFSMGACIFGILLKVSKKILF
jgi:hypothetical protein